jgi:hypothetical protein
MPQATKTYQEIAQEYAPYNSRPEFQRGAEDYMDLRLNNPFRGVSAQAWDRGAECAMRFTRQHGGRY